MNTLELMKQKLAALEPAVIRIADESARMRGMKAQKQVEVTIYTIVSHQFIGKSALARHRLVYDALREMMHKKYSRLKCKRTPEVDSIH